MRIGSRLLILAVALVLLGACAEANRVVSSKSTAQQGSGATLYTAGWRSDLYAPQAVAHSTHERDGFVRNCYDRATVGEPLPFDCLTRDALFNETGAFSRNPLATLVFSLLAIGGLLIFAMRRIGAVPRTASALSVAVTGTGATTRVGQRAPLIRPCA